MNVRRRWHYNNHSKSPFNDFSKKIKDYIVPIIWWILVLFLVWSFFIKSETKPVVVDNWTWLNIEADSWTQATIFYTWGKKETFTEWMKLFKSERIWIANWKVKIYDESISFNLAKVWDLSYKENGDFKLDSWDVWIDTTVTTNLDMKFAKLKIYPNSHISLTQNEMQSLVYVVSWKVEVSNNAWKNTILADMQKIEISVSEASNDKIDLSLKKEPLNDYFLKSDWFISNNWESYIWSWNVENTSTWAEEKSANWSGKTEFVKNESWKSKYLTFSNLVDESNVSSSLISISWIYDTEEIEKIDINGKVAVLNSDVWSFKVEWVSVPNKVNDIVFKVFGKDEELKEKFVYTVYYEEWTSAWNNSSDSQNKPIANANTFDIDGTKFIFTAPASSNTYTTYEDFVTIRWSVLAAGIDEVRVNNFKLKSYSPQTKTWRYHASTQTWNLAVWTNQYDVEYYSAWVLVYKNVYIIVKKLGTPPVVNTVNTQVNNTVNTNTQNNLNTTNNTLNNTNSTTNQTNNNSVKTQKTEETVTSTWSVSG